MGSDSEKPVESNQPSSVTGSEDRKNARAVCLQVRDYGKGVPENIEGKLMPSIGVGIAGMRERTRQLGGDLIIRRAYPGTYVEAWFPGQ
jgi:signal transduction histidine kinase